MKIFLMTVSVDTYGKPLKENLRFLNRVIENNLTEADFQSSFDEFWLTLSIPPTYVKPKIFSLLEGFNNNHNSLPNSRISKRYKKIDVTVKAPEFSEYFSDAKPIKYKHEVEVEPKYKNLSEVELAKILIDKFLEAGEIVHKKLDKKDIFDHFVFKKILSEIKQKIDGKFLEEINLTQKLEVNDEIIKRVLDSREKRRSSVRPKNKLIRDLRVYYNEFPNKAFSPFDYRYSEIFLNLLANEGLICPTYDHLYIQIAQNEEKALRNSAVSADRFVNGISVVNYEKYLELGDKEKEKFVFDAIVAGLIDIAKIDKLDITKIENVIKKIKEKGLDTELTFRYFENTKYALKITYFAKSMKEKCPVFFNLTDKENRQTRRIEIGRIEHYKINLWLQKITLTNKKIKVKSSTSIRGQVNLQGMKTEMEFEIKDLF